MEDGLEARAVLPDEQVREQDREQHKEDIVERLSEEPHDRRLVEKFEVVILFGNGGIGQVVEPFPDPLERPLYKIGIIPPLADLPELFELHVPSR